MVYAVILAGGKGERFWPLSREAKPKQFLSLVGKGPFLRNTFQRIKPRFKNNRIYVITHSSHKASVSKELPELNKKNIIAEPLIKNTAASIGLVAHLLLAEDFQAIMVILPSDHIIRDNKKFLNTISTGIKTAQRLNCLVTIGIKPRYGATGYGYLKIKSKIRTPACIMTPASRQKSKIKVYKVEKFIEKPDKIKALKFLDSERYLWNSGIFIFKASVILEAIKRYLPSLHSRLTKVNVRSISCRRSVLVEVYSQIKAVSIDYGVMEKAENIYAVLGDFFWDDLGSWASMERVKSKDKRGNIVIGEHKGLKTGNSTIICEDRHLIATLGISNTIIVHTPDATLVCRKDRAEDVKKLVKKLDKRYL